jgi:hypothetical protein
MPTAKAGVHHVQLTTRGDDMATYGKKASDKVEEAMHERKHGTLKSGGSGKKVTSRKQAIAIGLSEARKEGGKVPAKKGAAKRSVKKTAAKKSTAGKSSAKKSTATKSAATKSGSTRTAAKKKPRKSAAKRSSS